MRFVFLCSGVVHYFLCSGCIRNSIHYFFALGVLEIRIHYPGSYQFIQYILIYHQFKFGRSLIRIAGLIIHCSGLIR